MKMGIAILKKHHSADGLVTMREHIPLGKKYEIDLDSIEIIRLRITDPKVREQVDSISLTKKKSSTQ